MLAPPSFVWPAPAPATVAFGDSSRIPHALLGVSESGLPSPRLLLLQIPKHTLYPSGAFSVVTFSRSFFLTVLFGSVTLITQELPIGGLFLLVISGDTTGFNYWLLGFSLPLHTPHLGFMRLAG